MKSVLSDAVCIICMASSCSEAGGCDTNRPLGNVAVYEKCDHTPSYRWRTVQTRWWNCCSNILSSTLHFGNYYRSRGSCKGFRKCNYRLDRQTEFLNCRKGSLYQQRLRPSLVNSHWLALRQCEHLQVSSIWSVVPRPWRLTSAGYKGNTE